MNIGIFTDTYIPQINGVVTSVRMLEKELRKKGHKVYIFTVADPGAKTPQPNVFRLPSMPFMFLPTHRVAYMYSPKLLVKIQKFKLDIVHTQTEFSLGIFGKIVADFNRIPSVHTYHTMYEDYVHYIANGHLITPKFAKQYSKIFCNRAQAVICPVEKAKHFLETYGVNKPMHVIPTGLELEHFSPNHSSAADKLAVKKELGLAPEDPVIVSVGRVAKEKSLDVIVKQMPRILNKIPNAKLVIVGNGPLIEELQGLAAKLGVEKSVIFTGPRPWDEIGKYYQLGEVFVSASTSETQGLTYIEAMAAHVPVVVKKDDSLAGVIEDNVNGFYFQRDDEACEVIINVLTNPDKAKNAIQNGLKTIERFSAARFGSDVESLYYDVLEKCKKRPRRFKIKQPSLAKPFHKLDLHFPLRKIR